MIKFLALFKCAENSAAHKEWMNLPQPEKNARLEEGQKALEQWAERYKDHIVYDGGSLGKTSKIIDSQGVHDTFSQTGAFIVVEVNSHDEATNMFLSHPHFAYFPGDGVEVIECQSRNSGSPNP